MVKLLWRNVNSKVFRAVFSRLRVPSSAGFRLLVGIFMETHDPLFSRNINAEETCCSCRQLNSQIQKYFFTAKIILFYIRDIKYFHIKYSFI